MFRTLLAIMIYKQLLTIQEAEALEKKLPGKVFDETSFKSLIELIDTILATKTGKK